MIRKVVGREASHLFFNLFEKYLQKNLQVSKKSITFAPHLREDATVTYRVRKFG
jgi:hypothetical protein